MGVTPSDEQHLRRAIDLAAHARENGEQPYGSVLVNGDGNVVAEDWNTVLSDNDVTAHPELKLGRLAGASFTAEQAAASTLYTSCQPCAMCSETLARAGVGRVIFALSSQQLAALQSTPPNRRQPQMDGPALHAEAAAAIGDFYA